MDKKNKILLLSLKSRFLFALLFFGNTFFLSGFSKNSENIIYISDSTIVFGFDNWVISNSQHFNTNFYITANTKVSNLSLVNAYIIYTNSVKNKTCQNKITKSHIKNKEPFKKLDKDFLLQNSSKSSSNDFIFKKTVLLYTFNQSKTSKSKETLANLYRFPFSLQIKVEKETNLFYELKTNTHSHPNRLKIRPPPTEMKLK